MVLMMKSVCLVSDWIYLSDLHHARPIVRDADISQFKTNKRKEKKYTRDAELDLKCLILPLCFVFVLLLVFLVFLHLCFLFSPFETLCCPPTYTLPIKQK